MATIEEKRVYDDRADRETVLVAAGAGLAAVEVSGDLVGEFGLVRRCDARDVATLTGGPAGDGAAGADNTAGREAAGRERVAVATDEDVLLGPVDDLAPSGFGPSIAVGFAGDRLLAAGTGGRVGRRRAGDGVAGWTDLGRADGAVRAIDGDLVAADGGVYRAGEALHHAGLADVRDVSAAGVPLAATAGGLYRLGNGWMDALDGGFAVVAADPATASPGRLGRALAATDGALFEHRHGDQPGDGGRVDDSRPDDDEAAEWEPVALPVDEPVADVAYGAATYVVTTGGTFLANAGEGWRSRALGLSDVGGIAVL